jgi:UDP-N-acetylmuramoyl-tripeptide--D-alanyl-D-alanine ligase
MNQSIIPTLLPYAEKIRIDNRLVKRGDVFFAIIGKNIDGHSFALDCLKKGARYVVVSKKLTVPKQYESRVIKVPNTTKALGQLARAHRDTLSIPIIAIGGSNGKTTTKELLKSVLSQKFKVHASPSSFNNDIGVPLTLLGITDDHEIAIIEMGTNHPGELPYLCTIVHPTHALITSIGKEHLEGFGTIRGVIKEETSLYDYTLQHNGVLFVPSTVPELSRYQSRAPITFGSPTTDTLYVKSITRYYPAVSLCIQNGDTIYTISSNLTGSVNSNNILAAYAIGNYFGLSQAQLRRGISEYRPTMLRSMIHKASGVTYIVDCYNANPTSMHFALHDFAHTDHPKKIAIIGGMRELGSASTTEHRTLVREVRKVNLHQTVYIGTEFSFVAKKLHTNEQYFESTESYLNHLAANPLPPKSLVLLKGSKGIGLWDIAGLSLH